MDLAGPHWSTSVRCQRRQARSVRAQPRAGQATPLLCTHPHRHRALCVLVTLCGAAVWPCVAAGR
jgi:hypothetical protein